MGNPATRINKALLLTGVVAIYLSSASCDPAIGVALQNTTSAPKHITVIYPEQFTFPCDSVTLRTMGMLCDSIRTYELGPDRTASHMLAVPKELWDKTNRSYSFWLQPNYSAIVESRSLSGLPTYGQKFIIDQSDTIELSRSNKHFTKRPKFILGGVWTYDIREGKNNN